MNTTEAVVLARMVKSLCPTQPIDQYTPDAWADVLDDVAFEEAKAAVRTIYRDLGNDKEFGGRKIEPDDIIRQVKRVRADRVNHADYPVPPAHLNQAQQRDWIRSAYSAIAAGQEPVEGAIAGDRSMGNVLLGRPMS